MNKKKKTNGQKKKKAWVSPKAETVEMLANAVTATCSCKSGGCMNGIDS